MSGVPCPPSLREVVAGQLADLTSDVVWTRGDRFDPEEVFRSDAGQAGVVRVFVDLRAGREARLTLADARSDRFVVRRVPLANGLDELGREQIGQILRFAMIALRAGDRQTLSRAEARAALADLPPPGGPVNAQLRGEPTPRGPRSTVDIAAIRVAAGSRAGDSHGRRVGARRRDRARRLPVVGLGRGGIPPPGQLSRRARGRAAQRGFAASRHLRRSESRAPRIVQRRRWGGRRTGLVCADRRRGIRRARRVRRVLDRHGAPVRSRSRCV